MAALMALRLGGKAALMGGIREEVSLPYGLIMRKNLHIRGRYMYDRAQVLQYIKMIEVGNLKIGKEVGIETVGSFSLDQFENALDKAARVSGWGKQVIIMP
jgi:D-arabinose 1-dehydrogenase-like Zn-dependent alcohol dehydrogenase